jgi:hypothetical protein
MENYHAVETGGKITATGARYSDDSARSSMTYAGLRWRAVGTCFSQHTTEQNRSFVRPVLHDATVHRTAEAPGGINLRHVAQTMLAMHPW